MKKTKFGFMHGFAHNEVWPKGSYQQYLPKGSVSARLNSHWSQVGKYLSTAVMQYQHQKANHK